jgi:hypothetical protein
VRSAKVIEMRAHIDAVKVQYADFDAKLGQRDQIVKVLGDAQNALQALPARLSAVERAGAAADRRDASCALPQAQIDSLQAAPNPHIAEIARWRRRHDDHRAKIPELVKRLNEIREDIADLKVLEEAYRRTGFKAPAFFLALSLALIASRRALSASASASLMPLTDALPAAPVVAGFAAGGATGPDDAKESDAVAGAAACWAAAA